MRREKTLKLCANHFILPWMELKKNANSEKAWVWKTQVGHLLAERKVAVSRSRRIRTGMFLLLLDPDPFASVTDPDPFIIEQKL